MTASIRTIISALEQLSLEGYVFRGHEDFRYQLTPSAFREHSIAQMKRDFNISRTLLNTYRVRSCSLPLSIKDGKLGITA
ncbi:TPA: hypothetical protein SM062_003360 [Legionella pneumophila]|nr:hypothetical protein [Legionella pneumophila]HEK3886445.1 hypothetical protein [Legionella pneumophila]